MFCYPIHKSYLKPTENDKTKKNNNATLHGTLRVVKQYCVITDVKRHLRYALPKTIKYIELFI